MSPTKNELPPTKGKASPWWSSADGIAKAVRDAEGRRDKFLVATKALRDVLVGPDYGQVRDPSFEKTQNPVFSLMSIMLPDLFAGEPRGAVDVDPGSEEELLGHSVMHGANIVAKRQDALIDVRMAAIDAMCGVGCLFTEMVPARTVKLSKAARMKLRKPLGPNPWTEGEASKEAQEHEDPWEPVLRYVPPERSFYDMRRTSPKEREYAGHQVTMSLDELERLAEDDNSWDLGAVRAIRQANDNAKGHRLPGGMRDDENDGQDLGFREFVTFYQVWARDGRIEGQERGPNENGVMFTLWIAPGDKAKGTFLREPHYAKCSHRGPYRWFGHIWSGIDAFPLSPLLANKSKIDIANAVAAAAMKRVEEQKTVYVVGGAAGPQIQKTLDEGLDGSVHIVEGAEEAVVHELKRGGLYPELLAAMELADNWLARDLGMDTALRGAVEGGTTATEQSIAAATVDKRIADFRRSIRQTVRDTFKEIGWLIAFSSNFVVRATREARQDIARQQFEVDFVRPGILDRIAANRAAEHASQAGQVLIQGGDFAQNEELDFDAMEWDIEVIEEDTLTAQERRQRDSMLRMELQQLNVLVIQQPWFDWSYEFRRLELAYGVRGLVERFDPQLASRAAQVQIMQAGFAGNVSVAPAQGGQQSSVRIDQRPATGERDRMLTAAAQGQGGPQAQPANRQPMLGGA